MNADTINDSKHMRPRWLKPFLIILIVLGCLAFLVNRETETPLQTVSTTHTVVATEDTQPQPIETQVAEISDPLAEMRPQLQRITDQQTTLQKQHSAHLSQVEQQQQQINQLETVLADLMIQLTAHHNQLQSLQTARKATVVQRSRQRKKKPEPTMTLASIDQWGDAHTAVLQVGEQLVSLRLGDRHRGWQLTNIDLGEQQVELMNARKQHRILDRR
jgi:septal ring factor EnvC (AmiA/AmiB activator)